MSSLVQTLNKRLGDGLGMVCGGSLPRFAWRWAPDEPWFVYDRDDRTLLKRSWAEMPASDGGKIGRSWLLAEWRRSQVFDHHGFGVGLRVPFIKDFNYHPYLETVIPRGQEPDGALTANYIWALRRMMEQAEDPEMYLADEKYAEEKQRKRFAAEHLEASRAEYDKYTGAFGNLQPGQVDGWMSFGGVGDSPVVKRLQEATSA